MKQHHRILLLSYYFPPDLSAGSFRMSGLLDELQTDTNLTIDIITTLPNRYDSFSTESTDAWNDNVNILRAPVGNHGGGMFGQALNFIKYAAFSIKLVRGKNYDLVFATTSRLMTGSLGAWISKRQSAPFFLDLRDLLTINLRELLPGYQSLILVPMLEIIERLTLSQARKINIVSDGFREHVQARAKTDQLTTLTTLTNGIDAMFLEQDFQKQHQSQRKKVVYAGNIGQGQGLEKILPALAQLLPEFDFLIVGDGSTRKLLKQESESLSNIELKSPVKRQELMRIYQQADILFLHLNDIEAFRKVLPSKLFEYAATGKPVVAGVAGYAADFIKEHLPDIKVIAPCDEHRHALAFHAINTEHNPRTKFVEKFNRVTISKQLKESVLQLLDYSR